MNKNYLIKLYLQVAMKKLPVFIYICLYFFNNSVVAQDFTYNSRCESAYQAIFKLKIQEGNQILFKERQLNKNNLLPYFLENYSDFLALYISDDNALYNRLSHKKDERLKILASGDSNSPFYLYTQASIHLQWAIIKVKFGDYFSAIFDVRKAYRLLITNQEKFPDFLPNNKDLALLNTLFGAIPDKYKFGAKILGLKGDIDQGLRDFSSLLKNPNLPFREEATIMYTMLLLHLGKDQTGAWQMLNQLEIKLEDNLLNHFIVSSVAHYTGRNNKVIEILSQAPKSDEYFPFPYLNYMLGNAKLNRLDKDAHIPLKRFLEEYKGRDYIKEANRKLAWHGLVNRRPDLYQLYMSKILQAGNNSLDEDKAATTEALKRSTPNVHILRARLLSDGGYYEKALNSLNNITVNNLGFEDKLEYYYRKDRILDEMGQIKSAIPLYQWTINNSNNSETYFAPNSCIKLGNYYERTNNKTLATKYYRKASTYKNHEYKNSIDAQAKAGLNRIK